MMKMYKENKNILNDTWKSAWTLQGPQLSLKSIYRNGALLKKKKVKCSKASEGLGQVIRGSEGSGGLGGGKGLSGVGV